MAKMISKFHKLIQSKLLWIVFVALVVIGFVLLPVAANLSSKSAEEKNAPGMLNGKPVSMEDYRSARSQAYLSLLMMSLMYGQELNLGEEVRKYIDRVAWKRLITLRTATDLGLRAFDSEVTDYIKNNPVFAPEGKFNPEMYQAFKNRFLKMRGFSGGEFERHVAEEVVLRKTQSMIGQLAMVPPARIGRSIESLSDQFKLVYAKVGRDLVEEEVETTEEDARQAYENNPDRYTVPVHLNLKYIHIPYTNYISQVSEIGEGRLQEYYNNNMEDFRMGTNDVSNASTNVSNTATNGESQVYQPFDEVKGEIRETLRLHEAKDKAIDVANEIVFKLPPDRNGNAPEFNEVVEDAGFAIKQLDPFSVESNPPLDDSPDLVAEEAKDLRKNADEYFSDAIPADERVYILALEKRIPEYVAPFEEVQEEAFAVARERYIREALAEKAKDLMSKAKKVLEEGEEAESVFRDLGLQPEKTELFSLREASDVLPDWTQPDQLSNNMAYKNETEFVDPVAVEDGMLLAYVAERESNQSGNSAELRDTISQTLMQDRLSRLYDNWQSYLLESSDFKERTTEAKE